MNFILRRRGCRRGWRRPKGRLDKERAKVLEEEKGSAKVEVEWKGGGGADKGPSEGG